MKKIGPECALYEEHIPEKPYGWYFTYNSAEYLRTGPPSHSLYGNGLFLVEKAKGDIIVFSSACSPEECFLIYEAGFSFSRYDLTIHQVNDVEATVDHLFNLGMHHVIPKEEHGVIWKIPRRYTSKQFREMLSSLPLFLSGVTFPDPLNALRIFQAIDTNRCCLYTRQGLTDSVG